MSQSKLFVDLPVPPPPPQEATTLAGAVAGLAWERMPEGGGHASYALLRSGKRTGLGVEWCGHPTALWPYYLVGPGVALQTFRSSLDAKAAAERIYLRRKGR